MSVTGGPGEGRRHLYSCATWRQAILCTLTLCKAQADLVKDGGHLYFLRYLEAADAGPPDSRAQAAFVLAVLCRSGGRGQVCGHLLHPCSWKVCLAVGHSSRIF